MCKRLLMAPLPLTNYYCNLVSIVCYHNLDKTQHYQGKVHGISHQGAEYGIERVYLQSLFKEAGQPRWFIARPLQSSLLPIHASTEPFLHTLCCTGFAADSRGLQPDFSSDRLILQQAIQTEMLKFNAY
jgi:hypothetical protein